MDRYILLIMSDFSSDEEQNLINAHLTFPFDYEEKALANSHLVFSNEFENSAFNSSVFASVINVSNSCHEKGWLQLDRNTSLKDVISNSFHDGIQGSVNHGSLTIANEIHNLADHLPPDGTYFLDVCISYKILENSNPCDHICLLGAFHRLNLWHKANVIILIGNEKKDSVTSEWYKILCCDATSIKHYNYPIIWRGALGFENKQLNSSYLVEQKIPQWDLVFDLQVAEDCSFLANLLNIKSEVPEKSQEFSYVFSHSLEIIDECALSSIPIYLFSHPVMKLCSTRQNDSNEFITNMLNYMTSNNDVALISRLKFCKVWKSKLSPSPCTTLKWKKDIISGDECAVELKMCEPIEHFTFAITRHHLSPSDMAVYLLSAQDLNQNLALDMKENIFSSLSLNLPSNFEKELQSISHIDSNSLHAFLNGTRSAFREAVMEVSEKEDTDIDKSALSVKLLAEVYYELKKTVFMKLKNNEALPNLKNAATNNSESCDPWDWPERLYLFHRQIKSVHNGLQKATSAVDSQTAPMISAIEMHRHFSESGESKNIDNAERIQVRNRSFFSSLPLEEIYNSQWPEVVNCNYHDIYYHISGNDRELKCDEVKNNCLSHETASTCSNGQIISNKKLYPQKAASLSTLLSKRKRKKQPVLANHSKLPTKLSNESLKGKSVAPFHNRDKKLATNVKPKKSVPNTHHKKSASATSHDDLSERHKSKLREAVLFALEKYKIPLDHILFKPCARKLFAICKPFVKDVAGKGNTSSRLKAIADSHAKQVVDFEMQKEN